MNYSDAVNLLRSNEKFCIKLGLDRISALLELLGNPQDRLKYIHVAGTNGKGSVCAIISTVLREAGIKVGLYTSPHIFEYTERINICGTDISKDDFAKYVERICTLADKNNIELTEFEILTAVMFKYFADNNVEVVVLETGLGGRYDATNVIKSNMCAVITHIDFDHTERLGNTIPEIAFEKAGIIKKGCPVFTCEGYEVIKDKANETDSLLIIVSPCENMANLSLKGLYQQENLSLALAVVRYLFPEISETQIQNAISKVHHPYRFQYVKEKNMIIDAAHNPNGISGLRACLDFYYPDTKRRFIFGCLKNKDYKTMIQNLFEKGDEIYFYHFNYPNSATYDDLSLVCSYPSKEFKNDTFDYTDGKLTIVCGSFYMLSELLPKL